MRGKPKEKEQPDPLAGIPRREKSPPLHDPVNLVNLVNLVKEPLERTP
jgi:hypothetical protein